MGKKIWLNSDVIVGKRDEGRGGERDDLGGKLHSFPGISKRSGSEMGGRGRGKKRSQGLRRAEPLIIERWTRIGSLGCWHYETTLQCRRRG